MPVQPPATVLQTTENTRAALGKLLEAFTSGDRDRLAECYDDEVDWLFLAPSSVFPFAGTRHGRAEVFKGFAQLYESYRVAEYRVQAMVVDGDWGSTLASGQLLQVATGRIVRIRTGNFYRFRDDKVIEYRGFTDSLDIVEQVLGRELDF